MQNPIQADEGRIYSKYTVVKNADGSFVEGPVFVLRIDTDVHARAALSAYARSVRGESPALADSIEQWLVELGFFPIPEAAGPVQSQFAHLADLMTLYLAQLQSLEQQIKALGEK